MKFVALLSGGKDSCFNIMKCIQHNHDLVAVANLMPPESDIEEMNSFMYQSAAHNTIPLMAECFGVPLFRQEIIRKSLVQSLDYKKDDNDEVEDLFLLLQRVVEHYPEVQGVSCGAIISNYQRLRVEDVCSRLNLTPLTYLWQRDREILLDEIISSGVHAVLVKVAGAGLDPYKHLGKDLQAMRPTLCRLNERFGLDFCGEGGEYETLVLDCPSFKKRLVLLETEVLLDEEDCSVGNLRIIKFTAVDKPSPPIIADSDNEVLEGMSVEESIRKMISENGVKTVESAAHSEIMYVNDLHDSTWCKSQSQGRALSRKGCVYGKDGIGQTTLRVATYSNESDVKGATVEQLAVEQMRSIMTQLKESIEAAGGAGCDIRDACFIHLYLSDVALFQAVNSEYCKYFCRNPPSRSCVAVPLPEGVYVAADAVFLRESHRTIQLGRSSRRQVLHVRSVSEWAPLCIGPYAQANVLADSLIYVAGQIPLDPSRMQILDPCPVSPSAVGLCMCPSAEAPKKSLSDLIDVLQVQLALSLRHAARVLGPLNSSLRHSLCCTVYLNMGVLERNYGFSVGSGELLLSGWGGWSEIASLAERMLSCNCGEPVPGDDTMKRANTGVDGDGSSDSETDSDGEGDGGKKGCLRCPLPVLVVGVKGIPKDALVEAEVTSFAQLLPESSFKSSACEYLLPIVPPTTTAVDCSRSPTASHIDTAEHTTHNLHTETGVKYGDLDPDFWPLWHREELGPKIPSDPSHLTQAETGTEIPYHGEVSGGDARTAAYEVSTSAHVTAVDGTGSGPGLGVLSAVVRDTQCTRCVCSGTSSVSLIAPIEEHSSNYAGNVLQQAADLLFLGVAEKMRSACMTVADVRTLRVYYQPSSSLPSSPSSGAGKLGDSQGGTEEDALLTAGERIFGAQNKAFPLLIVPVSYLPPNKTHTPTYRTVFSASFLFIDLLQVKSETWIGGH